jgi:hypothetical protein
MTGLIKTYPIAHCGVAARGTGLLAAVLFCCSFPFKKTEGICPVREVEATDDAAATRSTGLAAGQAQAGATQR